MKLSISSIFIVCLILQVSCNLDFKYHTNSELEVILKSFEATGRNILTTRLYTIGNSSSIKNPVPLWVLELTAAHKSKFGVPNVKLVGNAHGNEAGGREILLHFIEYLLEEYRKNDEKVVWLLQNTKIHIIPTINPDGFADATDICDGIKGRNVPDAHVDLNRNFPDYFIPDPDLEQAKESKAIMKLMNNTKFILSAALHEGALVANYPYDLNPDNYPLEFFTPDNDVFQFLAKTYSDNHPDMHKGVFCVGAKRKFDHGIVNGADWYQFSGGMGDYNYNFHGCMEVTLELSCCKYPSNNTLPKLWNDNKQSLLLYCMQANRGVTGIVLDSLTGKPVEATLKIVGRDKIYLSKGTKDIYFKSWNKTGEFWRLLLPGTYTLKLEASGYYTQYKSFEVKEHKPFPKLTYLNIFLVPTSVSTTTDFVPTTVIHLAPRFTENVAPNVQELKMGKGFASGIKHSFIMLVNLIFLLIHLVL